MTMGHVLIGRTVMMIVTAGSAENNAHLGRDFSLGKSNA